MQLTERLTFFQKLMSCNYPVSLWIYDGNFKLADSTYIRESHPQDIIALMNYSSAIRTHLQETGHTPLILDTDFGLLWIAAFSFEGDSLKKISMVGPVFTGKNSHLLIKKKLDSYNLSVKLNAAILSQIESVPIIPTNALLQYATMLHCVMTDEQISTYDVALRTNGDRDITSEVALISQEHRGIWVNEQAFLKMIREGNPDYRLALEKIMSLSSGVNIQINDSMRKNKNNLLVLLTLCSRASMEGGLSPSIAYSLNDYYAARIEECKTTSETTNLGREMLDDFVSRVRQAREETTVSSQMQSICHYIATHLTEPLSLQKLADQAGYTDYYFSHKFKKELGCTVTEYIRNKKIEAAKLLLSGTNMNIQDISEELSFGSRSYFYSCFQKVTGMSPSDYRDSHYKL